MCFHKALHLFSKAGVLIYQATATVIQIISLQTRAQLPGYSLQSQQIDLEITSGKKLLYHIIDKNIIFQVLAALFCGRSQQMFSENVQIVNI